MGAAAAGAAFDVLVKVIGMVGDIKAWRLHVRMWAYTQAGAHAPTAEVLEEWVHDAARHLEIFGGQRREALRMWAYEQEQAAPLTEVPLLDRATALYDWAVLAERDATPDPPAPSPRDGFDKHAARIPTKLPRNRKGRTRR